MKHYKYNEAHKEYYLFLDAIKHMTVSSLISPASYLAKSFPELNIIKAKLIVCEWLENNNRKSELPTT